MLAISSLKHGRLRAVCVPVMPSRGQQEPPGANTALERCGDFSPLLPLSSPLLRLSLAAPHTSVSPQV